MGFHAWRVHGEGQPLTVLRADEIEPPPLGPGELRIKVAAASLGLPDYFMCTGQYPANPKDGPFTPGGEVVGTVIEVGNDVTTPIGARVMGMTEFWRGFGSLAETCVAREDEVNPAPSFLDDAAAASLRIAYHTAWLGVVRNGKTKPGEILLVLGAAGGVGAAAILLGKAIGAQVIAVAGSPEKIRYCEALGADHVIDRRSQPIPETTLRLTGGHGADVIYDPVGGAPGEEAFETLAQEGRFLLVGWASGRWPEIAPWKTLIRNSALVGVYAGRSFDRTVHEEIHRELMSLYQKGKIRSLATRTIGFDEVPDALEALPTASWIGRTAMVL